MRSCRVALILLFVIRNAEAGGILIDDFDTAEFEVRAGTSVIDAATGQPVLDVEVTQKDVTGVMGGARSFGIYDVSSTEFYDAPLVRLFVNVAEGTLQVEANQKPEELGVRYGTIDRPLNLDLRGQSAIQVDLHNYVERDDRGRGSEFEIGITSGFGTLNQSHAKSRYRVDEAFDGTILFPLASFGGFDKSDVDIISLGYSPSPVSFAFEIDRIHVIPEPSGISLFAIAALIPASRSFRKRS